MLCLLVAAATILAALSGCLSEPSPGPADPVGRQRPIDAPTAALFHVVGADGSLAAGAFAGNLGLVPVAGESYLGTDNFEPTIGSDADGCLYTTAFRGTGTGTRIFASCDQGATWEDIGPNLFGGPGASEPCTRNSNDPYVHVDRDTGRVFSSDLHMLVTSTLHYSDDKGENWTCNVLGGGLPPGVHDHQTIATGVARVTPTVAYPNMVYYCINRVGDSSCAASPDGGLGFGPMVTVFPGVQPESDTGDAALCGGLHGHVETDPEGRLFMPKAQCGVIEVARTEDDGLTWTRSIVSARLGITPGSHEVRVASDDQGQLFVIWNAEDGLPYISMSTDHGTTWSLPRMVAPPGVTYTGRPAIYATGNGSVAWAYIGITHPEGADAPEEDIRTLAYMGAMWDATRDGDWVITTMNTHDPRDPIDVGRRCWVVRCGGIGDFIDVTITPDGRPWAAFADMCDPECARNPTGGNSDGVHAFVGTFVQGRSLATGEPLARLAGLAER